MACVPSLSIYSSLVDDSIWDCDSTGILVDGNYAYVMSRYHGTGRINGIAIVSILDPSSPVLMSTFEDVDNPIMDEPNAAVKDGKYLYVVCHGSDALVILDVSNPLNPTFVGEANGFLTGYPSSPDGLVKDGNFVYTVGSNRGVVTFNVTDPTNPVVVGQTPTAGHNLFDVVKIGNYLFATHEGTDPGVRVYDVSTPESPIHVSSHVFAIGLGGTTGIKSSGNYLFVAYEILGKIVVLDASDPLDLQLVGEFFDPMGIEMSNPHGMALDGDYLYVSGNYSVTVLDVSNPTNPEFVGSLFDHVNFSIECGTGITKSGRYLFVNGYHFTVVDTECESTTPSSGVGSGSSWAIGLDMTRPSVAASDPIPVGLAIVGSVVHPDLVTFSGGAYSVDVESTYAYVVNESNGLAVIDISNPTSPIPKGYVSVPGAYGLAVQGNFAYVAGGTSGKFYVINIADEDNPFILYELSQYPNTALLRDVALFGDRAYITAADTDTVSVIDIGGAPTVIGSITSGSINHPEGIIRDGNYLYTVSSVDDKVIVIDITDETSPTLAGVSAALTGEFPVRNFDLTKIGDNLFVTDDIGSHVLVVDVSDPSNPTQIGYVRNTTSLAGGFGIINYKGMCFVAANNSNRVSAVRTSNPVSPSVAFYVENDTYLASCYHLTQQGDYIYATSYDNARLTIMEVLYS